MSSRASTRRAVGQFRVPGCAGEPECAVLGGVIVPETAASRGPIAGLVGQIRALANQPVGTIKAKDLPLAAYDLLAAEFTRRHWCVIRQGMWITRTDALIVNETLADLVVAVERMVLKLAPNNRRDLRVELLLRQLVGSMDRHPIYAGLLFQLLQRVGQEARRQGRVPRLTVWLDDRLRRTDTELVAFLGKAAVWGFFPERYKEKLGALLGAVYSDEFLCAVRSDDGVDGLILADMVAFGASAIARERPGFRQIADAMNRIDASGSIVS